MSDIATIPAARPQLRRGAARMKELAQESARERIALAADLLADLGRPPTAADRIAVETIAATAIRARQLRAFGRNDAEERRLLAQLIRASGLKPAPIEPPKPPTLAEQLAARGYSPPVARSVDAAPEQRGDATPLSETRSAPSEAVP